MFPDYEVIMTDVYKVRSHEVFREAVIARKNIILETPFNNEGFKDLIDFSRNSGYQSTLIVLFLKSHVQSFKRVAARRNFENGLYISEEEVEYNFIENFKNVARYFPYFDEAFFVYSGSKGRNQLIMKFQQGSIVGYKSNDFVFIQKFAAYSYQLQRLNKTDFEIIVENKDYKAKTVKNIPDKGFSWT